MAVIEAGTIGPSNMRLSPFGALAHDLLGLETIDANSEMFTTTVRAVIDASRTEVSMVSIDGGSVPPTFMAQGTAV